MVLLAGYSSTPGTATANLGRWPAESRIGLGGERPTLVLLAHPRCPCTRATLSELEILMAQNQGIVSAHVVFIRPPEVEEDWVKSDLWRVASAIPDVTVSVDEGGVEARRFRAETSGQALLFARDGRLIFQGGITGSRGHSGGNAGRSAITALLNSPSVGEAASFPSLKHGKLTTSPAIAARAPVFGCPLFAADCATGEAK